MMARRLLAVALVIGFGACASQTDDQTVSGDAAVSTETNAVIFVTIDGVRPEDLFGGVDTIIMNDAEGSGAWDSDQFREQWWRESREERRRLVMPFLWDTLVPMGVLVGDPLGANPVSVTNGMNFSGPGYTELFTGHARADVTSNEDRRYSYPTVFEVVNDAVGGVAAYVSWTTQARLTASQGGSFISDAPFDPLLANASSLDSLARRMERNIQHHDASIRYDGITHELALDRINREPFSLVHVGFGETDVDAHTRRYDRYIEMMRATDGMLSELWHASQARSALQGRVTMVVTTDHGRGAAPSDWTGHGADIENSTRWWFLAAGGRVTPQGVVDATMTQSQVSPTILWLLGPALEGATTRLTAPVANAASDLLQPAIDDN